MADVNEEFQSGRTPASLWWSIMAGFTAWGLDLGFSYVLQRHSCTAGSNAFLHLVTWLCFAIALSGVAAGIPHYKKLNGAAHDKGRRPSDRAYFQSLLGMGFSIGFAIVILAGAMPRWILSPCN
ncbi:MAG TPA: hypothetical protein VJ731_14500 [Terriglobales bacterium]|nr:hypothetical protein [Terriglobales bacterium]